MSDNDYRDVPLRLSYRLPPCAALSDADAARLAHEDLGVMSRDELVTESWRLRMTLAFGDLCHVPPYARDWMTERLARIRALLKETDR